MKKSKDIVYLKKMTKGDVLRKMTDEELANQLTFIVLQALKTKDRFIGISEKEISEFHLNWLREEQD